MIFRFVTGKLGTGKSLIAVGKAMEYLRRGSMVATNVNFYPERFPNPRNKDVRIIRLPDHPLAADLEALGVGNPTLVLGPDGEYEPGPDYDPKANSLLLLDELAQFMNSRNWNDKDRKNLISYLVLLRKMGWDAYFLVQHIDMIDKQIKESLASETGYCNNLDKFNWPFISPVFKAITGKPLKLPKIHRCTFRDGHSPTGLKTDSETYMAKHLYRLYNTAQKYSADYDKGTYCMLTPWHLKGRYMPPKLPLWRWVFRGVAFAAWAPYLVVVYLAQEVRRIGALEPSP